MLQLKRFIILFSALVAVASAGCGDGGNDYFCEKRLNQIHIVMTHNSLSHRRGVYPARNQNHDLVKQFKDGVRGFNFDLRASDRSDTKIWTKHGRSQSYDPTDQIKKLVEELEKEENQYEVIVIQVQNGVYPNKKRLEREGVDYLTDLFGTLLIKNKTKYLKNTFLKDAIENGERVYLTTDHEEVSSKRFYESADVIGENNSEWNNCRRTIETYRDEMPTECRGYPSGVQCKASSSMHLMNNFCGRAEFANRKCGVLNNAQRFKDSGNYLNNYPNILMVDYYDAGGSSIFDAQDCLRRDAVGDSGCEVCGKFEWDPS